MSFTRICLTIDTEMLEQLDKIRGLVPRSRMLSVLFKAGLSAWQESSILPMKKKTPSVKREKK